MTGAGFGGSAIALAPTDLAGQVADRAAEAFAAAGFGPPEVTAVVPSDGARRLV
jgi:galactokinase